jgi:radical SAM protein with 4Fe4S-binding SPASM domain
LGVDKISFQTLQTKENFINSYDKDMKSQIVTSETGKLKEKMIEAKRLADKYGIILIFDEDESPGCIWPWRGIYITYDGEVTACCKITEPLEFGLGNLLKQDFWEVWNGEKYQKLRNLLRERKSPPECVGCNRV